METRKCNECNSVLPATEEFFKKARKGKPWLSHKCRICRNRNNRISHNKNIKRRNETNELYKIKHRQRLTQKKKEWTKDVMKNSPSKLTYAGLHDKMRRLVKKPNYCPICNEIKKLEIASINHTYTENIKDWFWLCSSCHKVMDITIKKLEAEKDD